MRDRVSNLIGALALFVLTGILVSGILWFAVWPAEEVAYVVGVANANPVLFVLVGSIWLLLVLLIVRGSEP